MSRAFAPAESTQDTPADKQEQAAFKEMLRELVRQQHSNQTKHNEPG